ncbi:hypothetical protein [Flagellimonas myxillae]|uniref:hypothetical protein n=1 Tax=Flagellimonas myxillae TaxID=2942214 RepID=UPI00201F0B49|nr:hypothetical protein [Muricauda myxillae]MCL6266077.1 hypothetical protein [Muricauda myxillae]
MKRLFLICTLLVSTLGVTQIKLEIKPAFDGLQEFDKIRDLALDQTATEAYFTIQSANEEVSVIAKATKKGETWNAPNIASFSGRFKDLEPFLSPDGLRLYFVSNRPLDNTSTTPKDFDIWYVERPTPDSPWSSPINIGSPINTEHNEFYPAIAQNGNLYYTCDCPGALGRDDIFVSKFQNGDYTTPVSLGENINSEGFEYNAFIAPDDSYLIFGGYNREDGQGSGDLYISFKQDNGNWTKAKPLPTPINSRYMDYCPFVDKANNTLYFTSRRSEAANNGFETVEALSKFLEKYENGNSRLYKVIFDVTSLK